MPANASPALVLLTGNNYLVRPAADAALSGGTLLSAAITFDPNLVAAAQTGTVVSIYNAVTNQRSWRVTYNDVNGLATVEVYENPDGSGNVASRVSSVPIRVRSVLCFVYNGAGTLDLYINGVLRNGALTGTVPATLAVSTENLAVGAEAPSTGTGSAPFKGGIYHLAIWRTALTALEVATILRDGVTPAPLKAGGYNLTANWEHTAITAAQTTLFASWVDTVSNLALNGAAVTGGVPYAQGTTGRLLLTNSWDVSANDSGVAGQGLTTTYTLSGGFRLWFAGATVPQRATNYRLFKNDITIFLRTRKPVGTALATFLKFYGIELAYQLSSKELFCIVGDDTSNTLQNRKFSFGFNIFPVQGVVADIVLRYNSQDDNIDVFIGGVKYTATITNVNTFQNTTGLFLSDQSDFVSGAVVPASLADSRVEQLIQGLSQPVVSMQFPQPYLWGDHAQAYDPNDNGGAALPAANPPALIPFASTADGIGSVPFRYADAPYDVIDKPDKQYTDPLPAIVSISVDVSKVVTAQAAAGPTDAYLTLHWWEVELTPGEIYIVTDLELSTKFYANRTNETDTFTVPPGQNWNGKKIRFVVQAAKDAAQKWHSDWFTMVGDDYDNAGSNLLKVPVYVNPNPAITSVAVDGSFNVTLVGEVGPVVGTGVLPVERGVKWFWEIEYQSGELYMLADETIADYAVRTQVTTVVAIPSGVSFNGKNVRLVAVGKYDNTQVFKSAPVALNGDTYDNSGALLLNVPAYSDPDPVIATVAANASFQVTVTADIGPVTTTSPVLPGAEILYYLEVEFAPGEFAVLAMETFPASFGSRQTLNLVFDIPLGVSLKDKFIRLVARGRYDYTQVWKSAAVQMTGANFDNSGANVLNIPTYSNPNPVITSVSVDGNHRMYMVGAAGNLTSALIAFPETSLEWEIEMVTGEIYAMIDREYPITFTTRRTVEADAQIPDGVSFKGAQLRLVLRARYDQSQVWKSAPVTLSEDDYDNCTFRPIPFPENSKFDPQVQEPEGKAGPGVFRRRMRDFS